MVHISIDTEWSPSKVIRDVVNILEDYNVSATFFSTHDDGLALDNHERALHPNFLDEERSDEEILDEVVKMYPEAVGVRSHGLYTYTNLRNLYSDRGIEYESNYLMYREPNIRPFTMYPGIVQFPIYFMDDMWLRQGGNRITAQELVEVPGFKIFTFHPMQIYTNCNSIEDYEELKEYYDEPDKLGERRRSGYGVRDLFKDLLEIINKKDIKSETLSTVLTNELEDN